MRTIISLFVSVLTVMSVTGRMRYRAEESKGSEETEEPVEAAEKATGASEPKLAESDQIIFDIGEDTEGGALAATHTCLPNIANYGFRDPLVTHYNANISILQDLWSEELSQAAQGVEIPDAKKAGFARVQEALKPIAFESRLDEIDYERAVRTSLMKAHEKLKEHRIGRFFSERIEEYSALLNEIDAQHFQEVMDDWKKEVVKVFDKYYYGRSTLPSSADCEVLEPAKDNYKLYYANYQFRDPLKSQFLLLRELLYDMKDFILDLWSTVEYPFEEGSLNVPDYAKKVEDIDFNNVWTSGTFSFGGAGHFTEEEFQEYSVLKTATLKTVFEDIAKTAVAQKYISAIAKSTALIREFYTREPFGFQIPQLARKDHQQKEIESPSSQMERNYRINSTKSLMRDEVTNTVLMRLYARWHGMTEDEVGKYKDVEDLILNVKKGMVAIISPSTGVAKSNVFNVKMLIISEREEKEEEKTSLIVPKNIYIDDLLWDVHWDSDFISSNFTGVYASLSADGGLEGVVTGIGVDNARIAGHTEIREAEIRETTREAGTFVVLKDGQYEDTERNIHGKLVFVMGAKEAELRETLELYIPRDHREVVEKAAEKTEASAKAVMGKGGDAEAADGAAVHD